MTKNMFVLLVTLAIFAAGLFFKFDGFKVMAVAAFVMSLDAQIVMAIRSIKVKKMMEKINEESK